MEGPWEDQPGSMILRSNFLLFKHALYTHIQHPLDCIILHLCSANEDGTVYRYKPRKLPNSAAPKTLSQSMACFQDLWFMLKKMIESSLKLPIRHLSMSQSTGNPMSNLMHKTNSYMIYEHQIEILKS